MPLFKLNRSQNQTKSLGQGQEGELTRVEGEKVMRMYYMHV